MKTYDQWVTDYFFKKYPWLDPTSVIIPTAEDIKQWSLDLTFQTYIQYHEKIT